MDALTNNIVVSGRTSTLIQDQKIEFYDQKIPDTYSGDQIKNTELFSWYVSRHYALKTDYPADKAKFYLDLLELAYPHYVALFGREIPDISTKKMAFVYGSSKKSLIAAMTSDGLGDQLHGGGITMEGRKVSYQYPSGSLQYQLRYIILHEAVHLYQMCLYGNAMKTPLWFTEGIADMVSSHVYDSGKKQLTISVFDKAAIHNFADEGLSKWVDSKQTFQDIVQTAQLDRGISFLMAQYFYSDPERRAKIRIWLDEMYHLGPSEKKVDGASRLLQDLFGSWSQINHDFAQWANKRHNTFHYVDWGWEQNAEQLVSYGFPQAGKYARTDVLVNPGDPASTEILQMDYPIAAQSELVGPVKRGVAEPSIGALLDFSRDKNRGLVGLGLGVDSSSGAFGTILVDSAKSLVIDLSTLKGETQVIPFSSDLANAVATGQWAIGMTIVIRQTELEVILKAKNDAGPVSQIFKMPIGSDLRAQLLNRPVTILARGGYHGVTPYLDVVRPSFPDLSKPAPANRQYDPNEPALNSLTLARWLLREKTPSAVDTETQSLVAASTQGADAQLRAYNAFFNRKDVLIKDEQSSGSDADKIAKVVATLQTLQP